MNLYRWLFATIALGTAAIGCGNTTQAVTLRSLESNGEVSFLCMNTNFEPRDIGDCPDQSLVDNEARHLFALVTQTTRGEVALVDLDTEAVVDEDQTIPGFSFLPIGSQPTSIVSTPGGLASFVSVAEPGKEGIFALPTSCVKPRKGNEPIRDITTWPACRLPSAPGEMALLIDPPRDGDPSTPPVIRASCDSNAPQTPQPSGLSCPADLSLETTVPGRRKLAVALPASGQIAIVDAQELLDRTPGSYDPCPIERYVSLKVDLPKTPIPEVLPADLNTGYVAPGLVQPAEPEGFSPQPSGFALVDDPITAEHRLFVGDAVAPVVHVLDVSDPCSIAEQPPLLPESYLDPARVVTTGKIAASPLTTTEQRYLYAIDTVGGGSVMIFDISPGAANRTPLLRPRSPLLPFEPPDRIAFDAPARDVAFALRDDVPLNPAPPSEPVGVFCDPNPSLPATAPGAQYRPSVDLSTGAIPANLRGVFGFVALETGQISVVDVEDFDADCRRPETLNTSSTEDIHGCADDPKHIASYVLPDGTPTVTNEVSCHSVEPERTRSSLAMLNNPAVGVRAPSLRSFPRLVSVDGRSLPTDKTAEGILHPHMLGVNLSSAPADRAQVYIGTTLYDSQKTPANQSPLLIDPRDPNLAQSSLVLSFAEPRSYAPQEDFSARYEGPLIGERPPATLGYSNGTMTLTDSGIVFCDAGVEDESAASLRGDGLGVSAAKRDQFGEMHADYVQILSDLLDQTDTWWQKGNPGAACGGADPNQAGSGYLACSTELGTHDEPGALRELRIEHATRNVLTLTPRSASPSSSTARNISEFLACCFPAPVDYQVRASAEWVVTGSLSGFRHDITTGPDGSCIPDTNPLRSHLSSRVQEVSCTDGCKASPTDPVAAIGPPIAGEVACIFDAANPPPLTIGAPNSQCIYDGLTTSFAIYSGIPQGGQASSQRDDEFDWTVYGGFSPLFVNLSAADDTNTSPASMVYSPALGQLVVSDGSEKGLVLIDLATFAYIQIL